MCEICRCNPCHPQCPNFSSKPTGLICCDCGDSIDFGEEYIENLDGDAMHLDCACISEYMVKWLGFEVKCKEEY